MTFTNFSIVLVFDFSRDSNFSHVLKMAITGTLFLRAIFAVARRNLNKWLKM